ncbi:uncharacterized protein LOC102677017 isoform X2 [Apis dorsata]|uniref:uncharacterized protein LOC102677017 isoform X2 n=1 Tax=Apis dorsata TaxID=7462 RepID=UPI001292D99D|nr:uncharacterized protein LOC102677017 isoform X2 [Apis dorsata]
MPGGVVFLVCIPTFSYEHELIFGVPLKQNKKNEKPRKIITGPKVDVRLRETRSKTHLLRLNDNDERDDIDIDDDLADRRYRDRRRGISGQRDKDPVFVSMETVLEELLRKLKVEHVVWCRDKENMYYEVIFPVPAGEPCENCLHCLTEMGIGVKMNSIVSVIPTQCTYSGIGGIGATPIKDDLARRRKESEERNNAWKAFVESIRSKLTVKQVVDGVRSGGDLTFDYVLLVLTADCLAALGLIENSATNVVAAMLVSPLMGPVMSLTFGTIIADRNLQFIGLKSLLLGIFLSILFGFIFGLILGTTEMPWGYNDWPTDEMKGRGNYRSLWMGVLWALPSGTGVAVALLQGSNGPLIGVAISASLLPPVVNCIKEVAAPYTSTPELRRFWEHDIRLVRDKNISRDNSSLDSSFYGGLSKTKQRVLEQTLNEAVREAIDDETFRKVQRSSYGQHGPDEFTPKFGPYMSSGTISVTNEQKEQIISNSFNLPEGSGSTNEDLAALDRLITYLLGQSNNPSSGHLDSWRRSCRASARGYRQLRSTDAKGGVIGSNIDTTSL